MSIPVPLDELVAEVGRRSLPAYVLTSAGESSPHANAAFLTWDGSHFVTGCGNTMAANVARQSAAAVVIPPNDPDDYTLIFDATAEVVDGDPRVVHLTPVRAVLHRPGTGTGETGCGHDCKPLG